MTTTASDITVLLGMNMLGGAELSLIAIARGLREKGFGVSLATYGSRRDLAPLVAPDLPIEAIDANGSISALLPLTILLNEKKPRVLISGLRFTNAIALMASRFSGVKVRTIITEHTPIDAPPMRMKDRFVRRLMDSLYPRADAVVAVSEGVGRGLAPLLAPRQARVIYNPIIRADAGVLPPAHAWLNPGEPPVVMGVGRLSKEKNFDVLLRSFAEAQATRPMRLIILGGGDEYPALEALAKQLGVADRVLLPGFTDTIGAWLPHAKLFVCASRYEGFGNAIVEAMHYRVPVVSADCPVGPREILEDGKFGTLVPEGDAKALAAAMLAALDAPGDLDAGHARAQQFTEARCIDAYNQLINDLVAS